MQKQFASFARQLSSDNWKCIIIRTLLLVIIPSFSFSQTSPLTQNFDSKFPTASEWRFISTDGGYFNRTGGTFTEADGTGAYGVQKTNNGNGPTSASTTTLNFSERTFTIGSGALATNKLSFDLANPVATFSDASRIDVYLNINRTGFPTIPQLSITAPSSGPRFFFDSNPILFSSSYNVSKSIEMTSINSYINRIIITLPSSSTAGTRVEVRIVLTAGTGGVRNVLLVDNVTLTSGDASPLPVTLTRFEATPKVQGIAINWATASEKNNDHFDVQRSANGELFQTIGIVRGLGNSSSAHEYLFSDSRPLSCTAYYRLRQVDTDGTSIFSRVVAVQNTMLNDVSVYPNPTSGTVILPTNMGAVHYRILNSTGQAVLFGEAIGNDKLDLTTLPKGTFFLELSNKSDRNIQRLIRQ
ncbi:T9SS type A sorting domain-containing protein [Hymenobacter sedentarius]|uniref:T9SS type A sorting domain-containing protein n=1 Tax=Hymenobacter sedentarius TaxID=1411621 RepID=UPI0012FE633E|nr:T9SS type A sorting domain-containing protein [Hymenobacter sedentarius]